MTETLVNSYNLAVNDATTTTGVSIDTTNGNKFLWNQMTGLVIQNTGTTPLDVRISSQADSLGKTKIIAVNAIPANNFALINFLDNSFPVGGEVLISYNNASGTSTAGKILPINYIRP